MSGEATNINSDMAIDFTHLDESPYLLDLLIQMEDVIDTFDCYIFKNWYDAEVVDGPIVRRYWLVMTLKTPYRQMPDPRAAKRLVRQGVMVEYDHVSDKKGDASTEGATVDETDPAKDQERDEGYWLIKISVPRRLTQEINAEELEYYDDEIDAEDVQAANDQGIDDSSAFMNDGDEQEEEEDRQQEQEENSSSNFAPDGSKEGSK